jgi:phosphogluconate dehydratase
MSGASGKVPAAIHVTPEAADGGPLAYVRDGDIVRVDALSGELTIKIDPAELRSRPRANESPSAGGYGRELFGMMRRAAGPADAGACTLYEAA